MGFLGWNYYPYNEPSFVEPTALRYFHTKNMILSLGYACLRTAIKGLMGEFRMGLEYVHWVREEVIQEESWQA